MKSLIVEFARAVDNPDNWYIENGSATPDWNYIDADCYMACGKDYPSQDAFYDDWNTLCDLFTTNIVAKSQYMTRQLVLDKAVA
jgi:hypothetical protein